MRVRVVHALDRHLLDVRPEELARELPRAIASEPVVRVDLAPVDSLEHEHALRHEGADDLRHDEVVVVGEQRGDELGVPGLFR